MRRGGVAPLDDLIRDPAPASFHNEQPDLNYAASWPLVQFLLHADGKAQAPGFTRFLELDIRGQGGAEALYREIGMEPAGLQAAFGVHVSKLKAR